MDVSVQRPTGKPSSAPKTQYAPTPPCHWGNVEVFRVPIPDSEAELVVFGGGQSRGLSLRGVDLYIDLTGKPKSISKKNYLKISGTKNPLLADLEKRQNEYCLDLPTISLDWPDFRILEVQNEFWDALADGVLAFAKEFVAESGATECEVLIACQGGHGRTGTALALLGTLLGAWPPSERIILDLRKVYCEKAVESTEQLCLIEDFLVERYFPGDDEFFLLGSPAKEATSAAPIRTDYPIGQPLSTSGSLFDGSHGWRYGD